MKKRLLFNLLTLAAVLMSLQASAAMYMVGTEPFGDWKFSDAALMTDNGDGTYSYKAKLAGLMWFVFADGLANDGDWDTFNSNYRIGPTTDSDQAVTLDEWADAHKPSRNGAFRFVGNGSEYDITFDKTNMRFKITGGNFYAFESDGFYYNITSHNTVTLTHSYQYGSDYHGDVTVPPTVTHEGVTYTVNKIGSWAFYSCDDLTSVNLPTTVTELEDGAFYHCYGLTTIKLPESVERIGDFCFYRCDELAMVVLPSTLYYMGTYCFGACDKLSTVTCMATRPPTIGQGCFTGLTGTTTITLYVPASAVSDYQADSEWSSHFHLITEIPEWDFKIDGIYYKIADEDLKTVEVMYNNRNYNSYSGNVVIPTTVSFSGTTYTVTRIASNAFRNSTGLTGVTLPALLEYIGSYAFDGCTSLNYVTIPDHVSYVGSWAFRDCTALTQVTLGNGLTSMGNQVFKGCSSLTRINSKASTPPSITSSTLSDQYSTASLVVPRGAVDAYRAAQYWQNFTNIDGGFYDFCVNGVCYNITGTNPATVEVTYPGTSYSSDSYSGHIVIPPVVVYDGEVYNVTALGSYSFYNCTALLSVELPNTIKQIKERVFNNCSPLESLTLPEGLTSVGMSSIASNKQMKSLHIPSTLTTISYQALMNNSGLETITVASGNPKYDSRDNCNAIIETATNTLLFGASQTRIPETVTSIGEAAFAGINFFTIYIPNSVTSIGYNAFINSGLEDIYIPETVTSVGSFAFNNCPNLWAVSFGDRLPSLGYNAFYGCPRLQSVTCLVKDQTPPTLSANVFESSTLSRATLYVELGEVSSYQNAAVWQNFSNIEVKCYDYNMEGVYYLRTGNNTASVSFHDTDWSIDENTYQGDVVIPDHFSNVDDVVFTVNAIRENAFYNCTGLTGITLPESTLQKIEASAFLGCSSLTKVDIPESVTFVGTKAFYNCTNLTEVRIGANCSFLNQSEVFNNCDNIQYVYCYATTPPVIYDNIFSQTTYNNALLIVPSSALDAYRTADGWKNFTRVNTMYDFMVDGIYYNITGDGFASVTFKDNDLNSYSGNVVVPETVTYNGITYQVENIENNAFAECPDLTSVTLPNTINFIYYNAFRESGITSITVPDAVIAIGEGAFSYCSNLTTVILGSGLRDISLYAFKGSDAIRTVICKATTPPVIDESVSGTCFELDVYWNAVLKVPYDSHEAYVYDPVWRQFSHIVSCEVVEPSLCGDVNGDGWVNVSDVSALISLLLNGTASSNPAADVNGDGNKNINDLATLINMLLTGSAGSGASAGEVRRNYLIRTTPFSMIKVDGGTFTMGSTSSSSSRPLHEVTLSDYSIGETEVTQSLWMAVMGSNPSHFTGNLARPVENVSWEDAQEFIGRLIRFTGEHFRLPSEAEWEFAARGGNKSHGYTYSGSNTLSDVAWYNLNADKPQFVATKSANELGLYDMCGNVMEWCSDMWYYYTSAAQTDPHGIGNVEERVVRGGAYSSQPNWCEVGFRGWNTNTSRSAEIGLRLALGDVTTPLNLSQNEVLMVAGIARTVDILNGSGSYMFTGGSEIVSISISDNVITITARRSGSTTITVFDTTTGSKATLPITIAFGLPGDVNCDGRIDENDYAELWYIDRGKTPLSTYTADVNGDGNIEVSSNIDSDDLTALVRILYNDVMTNWNGYPFNNLLDFNTGQYDFNGDGEINRADLNIMVSFVLDGDTPASGTNPDMDNNGVVDWRDVCIFHVAWMKADEMW